MSNYIEYNDKIAFHPGYYIKEIVDDSGLTQEDFAKRLCTTPKNLSLLIRGEQSLSIDIAMKLSRLLGTTVNYWLNLQSSFDSLLAEMESEKEFEEEKLLFEYFGYNYFNKSYKLPSLSGDKESQLIAVRNYLKLSSLSALKNPDLCVSFRRKQRFVDESNIVKTNVMIQIAMNEALKIAAPRYSRVKFELTARGVLSHTEDSDNSLNIVRDEFLKAGVIFVVIPDIPGANISSAAKKIGDKVMLMVNDCRLSADIFWFTLLREVEHILHGDYGISCAVDIDDTIVNDGLYDDFFEGNNLLPMDRYSEFAAARKYDVKSIRQFARSINRNPGIVLGKLQYDGLVRADDQSLKSLRRKYKVNFS